MELQYFGANAIKISTKKASIVVDDNLAALGLKTIVSEKDIALYTSKLIEPTKNAHFVINLPGEYEVSDASIQGVAAQAHMDQDEGRTAVMYRIILEDIRIAVVGHIHPNLTDDELESLGTIDILFVPVGGNGYTLDGVGAHKVIKDIEPKIVIPTHYADPKINYEVPQTDLEEALKGVGIEASERLDSLKIKDIEPTDTTKLIVLNRQ
jgi:L-ascorbate metabolism protein UlaG (beta-lactamase superfamily)